MDWLRKWMLPLAMLTGVGVYLFLHYVPGVEEGGYLRVARVLQPILISVMLFLQLNCVAPSDLRFHRWHFRLLCVQALLFGAFGLLATMTPPGAWRILLECAMLCFICPTAAAAGVITEKIGGHLAGVMTYTVLSDTLACVMIPIMIPFVHPAADMGFLAAFWAIVQRVFSILLLPLVLAWTIRYLFPRLQQWLEKYHGLAFYIWGVGLTLAMSLATYALLGSGVGIIVAIGIGIVSLAACIFQFAAGRRMARRYGRRESLTSGQSLGQKNTGFIIWLGLTYMTPVTSVAGGLYAVWHNLVNTWELSHTSRH